MRFNILCIRREELPETPGAHVPSLYDPLTLRDASAGRPPGAATRMAVPASNVVDCDAQMTRTRTRSTWLAALAAGIVLASLGVRSGQTQGPLTPKPGAPVQQPPSGAIRVRVALVSAPVAVIGAKGEPILDLGQ